MSSHLEVILSLQDEALPGGECVVLLSPAIGVSAVAALAVWQACLGGLLGLDKSAWKDIHLEYNPYKYNSFAIHAEDLVYQLTNQLQC